MLFDVIEDYIIDGGVGVLDVWMSYGDKVMEILDIFKIIVKILICLYVVMFWEEKCFYGV